MNALFARAATLALAALMASGATSAANETLRLDDGTTFAVVATKELGRAPHGVRFSKDGKRAYVALSGEDTIKVLDAETLDVIETLPGGKVPLDVFPTPGGAALVVTEFRSDSLLRVSLDGQTPRTSRRTVAKGPSFFSSRPVRGKLYLACEFADRVFEVDRTGAPARSWKTGGGPYPAEPTQDGILLFVPNRTGNSVTVVDTLNDRVLREVPVGKRPEGGAVTGDQTSYAVACSGDDRIDFLNTASFTVVASVSEGIGPRPFSVATTPDGRFGLVNNAGGDTLSVVDYARREVVGHITVGKQPIAVRMHPDGRRVFVTNEVSGTLSVIRMTPPARTRGKRKTEVVVLGMVHGGHRESPRYGLDVVERAVRAIAPDSICTEIPPNRWERAAAQLRAGEPVTEARVALFPEYTDAILPLQAKLGFAVVPCAGWTQEMAEFRRQRLKAIGADPTRKTEWDEHRAALAAMEAELAKLGSEDDPRSIHSDAYDAAIARGFGPYDRQFGAELHDGGWSAINAKHYALIAAHLDRIAGEGKRVLITFGAAHKGWFLERLRKRTDVQLLDAASFLAKASKH